MGLHSVRIFVFSAGLVAVLGVFPTAGAAGSARPGGATLASGGEEEYFGGPKPPSSPLRVQPAGPPGQRPFAEVVAGLERKPGLFTLYVSKEGAASDDPDEHATHLYFEVRPEQLGKDYIYMSFLESGLGAFGVLEGAPTGSFVFTIRKVDDRLQFVMRNPYFRSDPRKAQSRAVERAFTESLWVGLPVVTTNAETKGMLVDLRRTLLKDRGDFARRLREITGSDVEPDDADSRFTDIRNYPGNVELSALLRFAGDQPGFAEGVPDARNVDLVFHSSISEAPENSSFRPRLADDRVGYFLRAVKDFSTDQPDPFVRYIIRWKLEKKDGSAALSEPKQPIVFWVENTTPPEYREAVKEGIEYWNKAFEAAGFKNAVVAKVMPDDADWDPGDVGYSVVRWIISHRPSFSGLGPAIANPLTGEILKANVLIEGESIRNLRRGFRNYVIARGGPAGEPPGGSFETLTHDKIMKSVLGETTPPQGGFAALQGETCEYAAETMNEAALGVEAMIVRGEISPYDEVPKAYIDDFIRALVAHEIGHVLGLRHNFKGSTHLVPEDLNDPAVTHVYGLASSVMDYLPVNIASKGVKQGDYFTKATGPYDVWAIQYGYTEFPGAKAPAEEVPELNKIAERAREPMLAYGTDEDAYWSSPIPFGPDPTTNAFDLSSDVLTFDEKRWQLIAEMWGKFVNFPQEGENFNELRTSFDGLFNAHRDRAVSVAKFIGGMYMNRYHEPAAPGGNGKPPTAAVNANTQRRALALLQEYVFSDAHFQFDPDLLKKLAPDRWDHWGKPDLGTITQIDYPLFDRITGERALVLSIVLNPVILQRVVDNELRTSPGEEALTLPELYAWLTDSVFTEIRNGGGSGGAAGPVSISALRRATQKDYVDLLGRLAVSPQGGTPGDAKALAAQELRALDEQIAHLRSGGASAMDGETRAHLVELASTIRRILNRGAEAPIQ